MGVCTFGILRPHALTPVRSVTLPEAGIRLTTCPRHLGERFAQTLTTAVSAAPDRNLPTVRHRQESLVRKASSAHVSGARTTIRCRGSRDPVREAWHPPQSRVWHLGCPGNIGHYPPPPLPATSRGTDRQSPTPCGRSSFRRR